MADDIATIDIVSLAQRSLRLPVEPAGDDGIGHAITLPPAPVGGASVMAVPLSDWTAWKTAHSDDILLTSGIIAEAGPEQGAALDIAPVTRATKRVSARSAR